MQGFASNASDIQRDEGHRKGTEYPKNQDGNGLQINNKTDDEGSSS